MQIQGIMRCCGARAIEGFYPDASTSELRKKEVREYVSRQQVANKGTGFIYAILNTHQRGMYGDILEELGFEVVGEARRSENNNITAYLYSPLSVLPKRQPKPKAKVKKVVKKKVKKAVAKRKVATRSNRKAGY